MRKQKFISEKYFSLKGTPNKIAYYFFRIREEIENKKRIASKLDISFKKLDNRIQCFNSLILKSKNSTATPSKEIKDIFNTCRDKTDLYYINQIKNFLGTEYISYERDEEIETKEIKGIPEVNDLENVDSIFKKYWSFQVKYQKCNLFDPEWNNFIKLVSIMNIKTRGIKIEKRIIANNNLCDSGRHEQGDA